MTGTDDLRNDLLLHIILDNKGKMGKVPFCQDLIQMGRRIEQTDLLL